VLRKKLSSNTLCLKKGKKIAAIKEVRIEITITIRHTIRENKALINFKIQFKSLFF
jgi:hypothetical protein